MYQRCSLNLRDLPSSGPSCKFHCNLDTPELVQGPPKVSLDLTAIRLLGPDLPLRPKGSCASCLRKHCQMTPQIHSGVSKEQIDKFNRDGRMLDDLVNCFIHIRCIILL